MSETPSTATFCVRHPDRQTYLACTRCGRPACPQCLVPASVGFHCVDCLASQPQPRGKTLLGAASTDGRPKVTRAIMAVVILAFIAQQAIPTLTNDFALLGLAVDEQGWIGVGAGEWWRVITVGFLHAGLIHLAFNMYALWLLGTALEEVLGHLRFAALYVVSLIGGSTASLLFNPPNQAAVGASGAIFGLFGALVIINRRTGRSATPIYGILILNMVLSFLIPQIDWRAHVGGLIAGACAAIGLSAKRHRGLQIALPTAVLILTLIAIAVRADQLAGLLTGYR
jgi:membrane associated rhomboid family serine protease